MRQVRASVFIDAPAERVWDLYTDIAQRASWTPMIVDMRLVGGGERLVEGARLRTREKLMGVTVSMEESIIRCDPPRGVTMCGRFLDSNYQIRFDIVPVDSGTDCTYEISTDYTRPLRPLSPFLDRLNRNMALEALEALKAAAEQSDQTGFRPTNRRATSASHQHREERRMDDLTTVKLGGYRYSFVNRTEFALTYAELLFRRLYRFEARTPSPLILDCGSHIGMSIIRFKSMYPAAKITGFEPNPATFSLLERNVSQNGLRDVELHNVALSDQPGPIEFCGSELRRDTWTLTDTTAATNARRPADTRKIKVPAVRLSDYITDEIDFIKLNIEGMEGRVMAEIAPKLRHVREMVIEFHGDAEAEGNRLADIEAILRDASFDYRRNRFQSGLRAVFGGKYMPMLVYAKRRSR